MPAYSGTNLYFQWTSTAGTVSVHTDFKTASYTPSVTFYDQTAGSDTATTSVVGTKGGAASIAWNDQTAGTAIVNALVEGQFGTLIIAPEGTATGKPKITIAAFSQGVKRNYPYNNLVELSCDFLQDGARTDATY